MKKFFTTLLTPPVFLGLLLIAGVAFADKPQPYVVSTEIIRVTSAADLASIPTTTADVLAAVDLAGTVASATLTFPTTPVNGQTLSVTTRSAVTTITNSTGGIPLSGAVTTLAAGASVSYVYIEAANRWYKNP